MYEYEDCTGEKLELAISSNPSAIVEYDVASLYDMGWDDRGSSVYLPPGTMLTVWQHPDKTGQSETYYDQPNGQCQNFSDDLADQVSHLVYSNSETLIEPIIEPPIIDPVIPEPEILMPPVALIYENDDCSGDQFLVELEQGQDSRDYTWDQLYNDLGWNDRGRSVIVADDYKLTLWQHPNMGGVSESYDGQSEVCQQMSGNMVNQLSYLRFEKV